MEKTIYQFANECLHEMNFGNLPTTECVAKYLDLWHKEQTTFVSPANRLPNENEKVLFKIKSNDIRLGVFMKRDEWGRPNMFCDGSFHQSNNVSGWFSLSAVGEKI